MSAIVQHSTLTDPNIHEPKGASSAAAGAVLTADGAGNTSFVVPASGIYGTEQTIGESLGETVMTSTTFLEKVSIAPTVPAGTYRLDWSYQWNHDATTNDFEAQIEQDDSTQIMFHKQEPQDSGGGGTGGTDQRFRASGFILLTLAAGSYQFDLDFRTSSGGDESMMADARLMFYRIG